MLFCMVIRNYNSYDKKMICVMLFFMVIRNYNSYDKKDDLCDAFLHGYKKLQ